MKTFLWEYGAVNFVIGCSLLVSLLLETLFRDGRRAGGFKEMLRWRQALLLVSILSPCVFFCLPQKLVDNSPIRSSLSEWVSFAESKTNPGRNKPVIPHVREAAAPTSDGVFEFFRNSAPQILFSLLTLGFLAMALRLLVLRARLIKLLINSHPILRFGRIHICACHEITVPFSTFSQGIVWVVLPEILLENWKDLKLAIRHELQHHRQRDAQWAIAMEWIAAAFFWNPAIHIWKRRTAELQELACDEALVRNQISKRDYGHCLLRVAELSLSNYQTFVPTVAMASASTLKRRIEMLNQHTEFRKPQPRSILVGLAAVLMTLGTAFGVSTVVQKEPDAVGEGILAVEPTLQKIAEKALAHAVKKHKAKGGFVIISNPTTGQVLAVANQDKANTVTTPHGALSFKVGPASLLKPLIAAESLERGLSEIGTVLNCENGNYSVNGHVYRDWKSFDKLTTAEMMIQSSNICGIKLGQKLGANGIASALRGFGFGEVGTAKGFPEARTGRVPVPSSNDDASYIADVSSGMGKLYATPLELVQAFGAIANGGDLLEPQAYSTHAVVAKPIRRVLSRKHADEIKEALVKVLEEGTASGKQSKLYRLAGKTATGYRQDEPFVIDGNVIPNVASFIGFGPVEKPRVLVYAAVEGPTDMKGAHGAIHAAPLFRVVAEKALTYLGK